MKHDDGSRSPVRISSYTDADHAGDKVDRKSVSGAMIYVNGMLCGWQCQKQAAVALSTAESEFVSGSVGAKGVLGMYQLVGEIGLEAETPMVMNMDSQAAIKQVENEVTSSAAKHIDVRLKFIRDYAQKKLLQPVYVATQYMRADVLTKALTAPRLKELREMIGLR
jgi:hypothetical protein